METFVARRRIFDALCARINAGHVPGATAPRLTCPCCGYPTLAERATFDICSLCSWEDDGQDDHDADEVLGGPNADYSLSEARQNFDHHLMMYRSSDSSHSPQNPKMIQLKRDLIAVYMPMLKSSNETFKELEQQEKDIDHKTVVTSRRERPLP